MLESTERLSDKKPKAEDETKEATAAAAAAASNLDILLSDNPCWGSPTQCDLKHLITQYPKNSASIVYESSQYLVLNKPPDLRMDREYPSTVHKLLTYWYPSPSLIASTIATMNANGAYNVTDFSDHTSLRKNEVFERLLLEAVSKIHQYNTLADNTLRPCHQLDYATSGLLCIARTKEAASFASLQWEARSVSKEYLAIIQRPTQSDSLFSSAFTMVGEEAVVSLASMPCFPPSEIISRLQSLEQSYKKTRQPNLKKRQTFNGFQPTHAIFQKYQARLKAMLCPREENKNNDPLNAKKRNRKRPRPGQETLSLTADQWDLVWEPVEKVLSTSMTNTTTLNGKNVVPDDVAQALESMSWKTLSRTKPNWKEAFRKATDVHNTLLRETIQKESISQATTGSGPSLPTFFGEFADNGKDAVSNVIYISCPIAVDPDSFVMKVPPITELIDRYPHLKPFVGRADLDYKPCLTKCTILSEKKCLNKEGKSKVQLLPMTGRRHQLRVHMALLAGGGYGILGDATYNIHTPRHLISNRNEGEQTEGHPRMCLHSHKLSLRLLDANGITDSPVSLLAPDPF